MECKKIKSLLSEYLDSALRSDLNREVKEHLLSCKECSNEFFIMKSIAGELADMERIKAPNYLLNRVNRAVASPSWISKIFDFIPGSGGFKLPMEFVTLAATVVLVFLIFSNIHFNKNGEVITAGSDKYGTLTDKESGEPVELNYIPAAGTESLTLPSDTDSVFSVGRGRSSGNNNSLISDLEKMIFRAGGNIVLKKYARDSGRIDAITVKIPSDRYGSFIRTAEMRGRFKPPAPSLSDRSSDPVLLRISLNLSE